MKSEPKLLMQALSRFTTAGVCGGLFLCCPLVAQEKPTDRYGKPTEKPDAVKRPVAKVAFLGVLLRPIDEALAAQTGLPEGVGVLVVDVIPESPAARAGVQRHDVLHLFNDQLLVNEPQLMTLVRHAGAGAEVKLTLLRKGKKEVLSVTLGEQEVPIHRERDIEEHEPRRKPDMPMRRGIEPEMRRDAPPDANDGVSRHLRELHERMNEMRESLQREMRELSQRHGEVGKARAEKFQRGAPVDNHKSRTSVENTQTHAACSDEQGSGELVTVNGAKQLTARDREGKVIFDGPVNTEAERAALPPAARERLERIEKSTKAEVAPAPEKEQA